MRACMHKCLCVCGRVREVTWTEPRFRGCRTERLWGLKTKKETQSTASSFRSQTVERKTRQSGRGGEKSKPTGKSNQSHQRSEGWGRHHLSVRLSCSQLSQPTHLDIIAVNNLCPLHNLWDWHSVLFSYISRMETLWTWHASQCMTVRYCVESFWLSDPWCVHSLAFFIFTLHFYNLWYTYKPSKTSSGTPLISSSWFQLHLVDFSPNVHQRLDIMINPLSIHKIRVMVVAKQWLFCMMNSWRADVACPVMFDSTA